MKILLTGGAGFIGSHTCVELVSAGHQPVIVDNFYNASPKVLDRLKTIIGQDIPFYEADVSDEKVMNAIFEKERFDAVIHFAGYKAVGESVSKPLEYYRNNLDTTLTLCECMRRYGVKRIVFSSSATVYGLCEEVPFREDMRSMGCTNPYGWTKYMIEQILKDVAFANPDWSVALLRYFNPIGAHESGLLGEEPNGIPNNLMPYITEVAAGRLPELHVYGDDYPTKDGTGVRDYIHVVDLAVGHIKALRHRSDRGVFIYNLGTGVGYSVFDIIRTFERVNGITIPYTVTARRPGDIAEYYADPAKALRELGWKAERGLEDMCRSAWHFIQGTL